MTHGLIPSKIECLRGLCNTCRIQQVAASPPASIWWRFQCWLIKCRQRDLLVQICCFKLFLLLDFQHFGIFIPKDDYSWVCFHFRFEMINAHVLLQLNITKTKFCDWKHEQNDTIYLAGGLPVGGTSCQSQKHWGHRRPEREQWSGLDRPAG